MDHFEPYWNNGSKEVASKRIKSWIEEYTRMAKRHKDSGGNFPKHTFFYPEEEYREEYLCKLSQLCKDGYGEVEIHLHHDHDTAEGLKRKVEDYKGKLDKHGLLSKDNSGSIKYGFIHGNWALDNSRVDGKKCGVNNELGALKETGCYADFTLPSAPDETQTKKINSIYYAEDNPDMPKSHNTGIDVEVGRKPSGDLMIIQGPLTLNWKRRKLGIFPRVENGEVSLDNPPTPDRIDLWIKQHIHVKGRPEWIFVKVYTHGTQQTKGNSFFANELDRMFAYLEKTYNEGKSYKLHYMTA